MKILFFHGLHSIVGGVQRTFLQNAGHEGINPALDHEDFDLAVRTAQAEYDLHQPDVIVRSSRGGAVAMNIDFKDTLLVLLCPAWKRWGKAATVRPQTTFPHSRRDDAIPFADSEELVTNSGLPPETLIEIGNDHRLANPVPLKAMLNLFTRKVMNRILLSSLILLSLCPFAIAQEAKLTLLLNAKGEHEVAPHGKGNIYAPCVLMDGGIWRMWYGGQGKDGHDRILYAESEDGRQWNRKGVALEDNTANHINDPSVVKVGNFYFMYFTRAEKFVIDRIHVAASKDGLKWDVVGVAIDAGKAGAWDSLSVGRPSVIYDEGTFKMWYDGRKDFPIGAPVEGAPMSNESHRFVGYATSQDGIHWVRNGDEAVFGNDAGGIDVQRIGSTYIMVYESHGGTRYAKSDDGIVWKDEDHLLRKSGGEADRHGHVTPFLFQHFQHERRLFFGAAKAATWDQNVIASSPFILDGT